MKTHVRKDAVNKDDLGAIAAPYELTNIDVKEVSIVDAAANRKKFLVTKRSDPKSRERSMRPVENTTSTTKAEDMPPTEAEKAKEAEKVTAEKAATEKASIEAAAEAEKVAAEKAASEAAEVAKAAEAVKVAADALAAVGKTEAAPDITVADPPPVAAPTETVDRVKAAILGVLDAVGTRLDKFRSDVNTGTVYNDGVPSAVFDHVYYLRGLLDSVWDIGGPYWEARIVQAAAVADIGKSATPEEIAKAGKAITAARVQKMKGIHKAMAYCTKDMDGLVSELDAEYTPGDSVVTSDPSVDPNAMSFAKAEAEKAAAEKVAAEKAAADKSAADITKAQTDKATFEKMIADAVAVATKALTEQIASKTAEIEIVTKNLQSSVNAQAIEVAKARNTIADSQQIVDDGVATHDTIGWSSDMAAPVNKSRGITFA